MRTALIDSDVLVWEAGTAAEVPIEWHDGLWTLHAFLEPAIEQLKSSVEEIKRNLEADQVVMALSDYTNPWRKLVMPSYKGNRKATRKPVIYNPLREFIHEAYSTYQRPGLEGDDVLGILLTTPALLPGEKIVVSIDKDMKTLPGLHVNLKRARESGQWFPYEVTENEADAFHLTQTLTGDTVDGYPGCPGQGPVGAAKVLAPYIHEGEIDATLAWVAIVEAYTKKGLGVEVALQNARVARICRHEDYDFNKKQVRLWEPPTK